MTAGGGRIEVRGLKDFQAALRQVDATLPRELRLANLEAAKIVADATRSSFASRGGVAPKVAPSVKALAQQRNASVRIGGAKYPFAMGAEFGSIRFKQFPAWRGKDAGAGYSLWPTIRAKREEVVEAHGAAIDRLLKTAFPD